MKQFQKHLTSQRNTSSSKENYKTSISISSINKSGFSSINTTCIGKRRPSNKQSQAKYNSLTEISTNIVTSEKIQKDVRVCCRIRPNFYQFDHNREDFAIEDVDTETNSISSKYR